MESKRVTAEMLNDSCSRHSLGRDPSCEACRYAARAKALAKMVDIYSAMFAKESEALSHQLNGRREEAIRAIAEVQAQMPKLVAALAEVSATVF